MQRIWNSTVPFSHSTQSDFKGLERPVFQKVKEPDKVDSSCQYSSQYLWKIISQGTAKHEWMNGPEKQSIIAQAECESQDSQEFCPNGSHKNSPRAEIASASLLGSSSCSRPKKKKRKRQRRLQGIKGDTDVLVSPTAEVNRVSEQDSGECLSSSGLVTSSSISVSTERVSVQETAGPSSSSHCETSSACHSYSLETECSLALEALRNFVTTEDRCYAYSFVKDLLKRENERNEEEPEESERNAGLLFKEGLYPVNYEYREGQEYERLNFIKQGSFGEVYSVKDKGSGFVCAAKKVALVSFRSEEVGSWSCLQSPQVVELFGVVREGPSIILFMDLKSSSLGQLVEERGRLPEDLSLHYLQQVLESLDHLHRRHILHLDIKADNVLLSEDGKDIFLCDFGHAEQLDAQGLSYCQALKGTETHMAPEVVLNKPRSSRADIWSSCCMLLHMLNGCHPWTRYYSRPLFFKIAEEPPPLKEIPSEVSSFTADVIRAGLQKDPTKRPSASQLLVKTARALKEVGGLRSAPREGTYQKPSGKVDSALSTTPTTSHYATSSHSSELQWMSSGSSRRNGGEECEVKLEKERRGDGSSNLTAPFHIHSPSPEPRNISQTEKTEPEQELWRLGREFVQSSLSQLHSAETQEQLLSCLGSDCLSTRENWDKKDSGHGSVGLGDELSSGVFSSSSQPDNQSFGRDWLTSPLHPPPRCFEGVDVYIKDFNGDYFHIRERPRVKVSYVARGISDQISESLFTLQMENGCVVSHDEEVEDTLYLCCVPAPDCCRRHGRSMCTRGPKCSLPWSWRIREGVFEKHN